MKIVQNTRIPIFIFLLLWAFGLRFLFAALQPEPLISADSYGYYNLGRQMLREPSLSTWVSEFRTPVYPLFVASIARLSGVGEAALGSFGFRSAGQLIAAVQAAIGIFGVLVFYLSLLGLGIKQKVAVGLSGAVAADVLLFARERSLLTEGVAITSLIITFYLFVQTLQKPTNVHFFYLLLSYAFNFLLRPAFIIVPLVSLPFTVFYHRNLRVATAALVSLALYLLVPAAYAGLNQTFHRYAGIQHVGDIDLLGRILQFNLSVESAKETSPYFYKIVTDYRRRGEKVSTPFVFLDRYDPGIYTNTARMNELQAFDRTVLGNNLSTYLTTALSEIPAVILNADTVVSVGPAGNNPLSQFFWVLQEFYRALHWLIILVIPLYPLALVRAFKKPTLENTLLAALGTLILAQIILTSLVVYEDYGRMLSVIVPEVYLFLVGSIFGLEKAKV